jgi:hypothetical protein
MGGLAKLMWNCDATLVSVAGGQASRRGTVLPAVLARC